jgi:hypothetical protein
VASAATFTGQGLVYAAHAGGSAVAVDDGGHAFVVESAPAPDGSGARGVYVTKLEPDGRTVVYRTYVGHGNGYSIAVDAGGNAYVAGRTNKNDFPATVSYTTPGTDWVGFVVRLDAKGTIVYSAVVGGTRSIATGVAVDAAGNAYATGAALTGDFPTTEGAFQRTWHWNGGFGDLPSDAFVFKLGPAGSLIYSTLLGGNDYDHASGIAVDQAGCAYVTGRTVMDFPVTAAALQPTPASSWTKMDAFVTKLNATGSALVYSTYIGGSESDFGNAIAVDSAGNAYIAGETNSRDFPTTPGAAQRESGNSESPPQGFDAFVAKLSPSGGALSYGTYLGGAGYDAAYSVAIDAAGHAFVAGGTGSAAYPVTARAFQTAAQGGDDAFLTELDEAGAILYSTRLGGSATDGANAAVAANGDVYLTGSNSADFPFTAGAASTVPTESNYSPFTARLVPRATLVQSATASSIESASLNGAAAIDGDPATRWSSQFSDPQWLRIDLGRPAAIDRIILHWETAYASAYQIEVSDDAMAWTVVYSTGAGDGGIDDVPLAATGRYIRMLGNTRATPWGYSLWEFDVFGAGAAVNVVPTIRISYPSTGAILTEPATFPIDVDASDADGTVARVDLYVNGELTGTDTAPPFSFVPTLGAGKYTIGVAAHDNLDATAADAITIEVIPAERPGHNLAYGRPVTSSSNESAALRPENAVDGNATTRWASAFADNQWISVDLGGRYRIVTIVLNWETAYASGVSLEVSDDGISWSTLYSGLHEAGGTQVFSRLTGAGRYVRVWGLQRATPWGFSLYEIEVYGVPEPNIAAGKPAFASSIEDSSLNAGFATDTLLQTRWSSAFLDNQWIAVDLGGYYELSGVTLRWETASASEYLVQVSLDGSNWRSVVHCWCGRPTDRLTVPNAFARYVRVYGLVRATPWGISLWEFEVYGTPVTLTQNLSTTAASVTASSIESADLAAARATDDDVHTRWSSAFADDQWLTIDLGTQVQLRRVVLAWETAYAASYAVEVSADGATWHTAFNNTAGDGGIDDLSIEASARYVRIACRQRGTPWGFSLWEVGIYSR